MPKFDRGELARIAVAHVALFALVAGAEGYLRFEKLARPYLVHPSGVAETDRTVYGIGLSGPARFSVSSLGLRGSEPFPDAYKILIAGSSGALNWMLDDREAWPSLLEEKLRPAKGRVWTGNAGRLGNRLVESAFQLETIFAEGLTADLVLVELSGTEVLGKLFQGSRYRATDPADPAARAEIAGRAFAIRRGPYDWRHWALMDWLRERKSGLVGRIVPPADYFAKARSRRAGAVRFTDAEPALDEVFVETDRALELIARTARANKARVVFFTRPTLWKADMTEAEQALLWLGHGGENEAKFPEDGSSSEYYTPRALAAVMDFYRTHLLGVCASRGFECWDLAPAVPRTATHFFDDTHLTPTGAALVADFLAEKISGP